MIVGALDVGTNTILMLVAECSSEGTVREIDDLGIITRLGRGVDRKGVLDPAAAGITLSVIDQFVSRARDLGATRILTAATCALRDARDGAEFIKRVLDRTGVALDIIPGEQEARLSWLAVAKGLDLDPALSLLIVDIGGGSTELIWCEPGHDPIAASLQVGSVRMTERFIRHDPPDVGEMADLRRSVSEPLIRLGWQHRPDRLVGVAGTVTTICAVAGELTKYDRAKVHGCELSREQVFAATENLTRIPLAERKRLPGMAAERADVIVGGAIILECVMEHFGARSLIVSDRGVRWGLVYREMERVSSGSGLIGAG